MAYENLALKYRPVKFADLIGQESVSKTILNAIASKRIVHSYLFYGPRGCGKTSAARILSKTLNCEKLEKNNPCNKCQSCMEISQSRSIDVIEIDAASHTQVANIREVIIDNVNLVPSRDKYKVYILDEVHMLSNSAFNALLKTIEEPPEHVVFIMATTEINKVPATIISRCQTFRFRTIPENLMFEHLIEICKKENFTYEEEAISLIVKSSGGAMRDALTLLDRIVSFSKGEIKLKEVMDTLGLAPKEIVENLAKAILDRNSQGVNESFKKLIYEGYDILAAVKDLRNFFSECFLLSCGFSKSWIVNEDLIKDINPYVFAKLSRKLNRIIEEIKFSDNIAISAEMAIHTIIETPVDLEAIVKKIEKLENVNLSQKEEIKQEKKEAFISISEEKKEKENVDSSVIWQKFLNLISKQEMALYNFLSASSMKLAGDRDWILEFENEFQKDYTLSKMDKIKETLKKITDNDIKISLQIKKKELIEELSNPSQNNIVQKEDNKLKAVWSDIESILPEQNFPEYERIEKILKGHIKKIHKVR